MYLSKKEERILDGEDGYANQIAMKILVALGDINNANKMIPIESAHLSGVSYKTLGDAVDFLEMLEGKGAQAKVYSSLNPCGLDLEKWTSMPVSRELYEAQLQIINLYQSMGVSSTLTCTPYYVLNVNEGDHLAWAESSALSYANSLLGAQTNREGGPSALAAALIGYTPNYGLHLTENRRGNLLINVKASINKTADYSALGVLIGESIGTKIPVFKGLEGIKENWAKALGAAMAASGSVPLFHVENFTPEWNSWKNQKEQWLNGSPEDTTEIDRRQLDETYSKLTTSNIEHPDLFFMGCPHCSLSEIAELTRMIKGRKLRKKMRFWLCTSRYVKMQAEQEGLLSTLETAGIEIYCDTCIVVTWLKRAGINSVATNSGKAAYYAPSFCNVDVVFNRLDKLVDKATE